MKIGLLALLLLILLPVAAGYDISTFLSQDSSFLKEGESIEQPTAQIKHMAESYWVVPVIQNTSVVTYLPLFASEKKVENNTPTNRKLFTTADILRSYLLNKKNIISNPGTDFFITSSNSRIVSNLSRFLADEIFEMNIIQQQMNETSVKNDVDDLKSQLVSMSELSSQLSVRMDDALSAESVFTQTPDTNSGETMKKEFDQVYELLFQIEEEALDYRSGVDQLKQNISLSSLDVTEKNNLIGLASPPAEFELIGKWVQDASGLQQITDSVYANTGIKTDGYLAEFDLRVKRNNSYQVMYGIDEK